MSVCYNREVLCLTMTILLLSSALSGTPIPLLRISQGTGSLQHEWVMVASVIDVDETSLEILIACIQTNVTN